MPFYIRKSVSAGPFRFNFSKGGVGVSVGVKGLRVGTGPRGHYIHAGRGGLYYRATLSPAGARRPAAAPRPVIRPMLPDSLIDNSGVEMIEIESSDVLGMRDEAFSELLSEINRKAGQVKLSMVLGWGLAAIGLVIAAITPFVDFWLVGAALPGYLVGLWLDSYRRKTVLFYELDETVEEQYQILTDSFDTLSDCAGKWHIEAGGQVTDLTTWKRNAGASHIVRKKPTTLAYALPEVISSNVTPPALHVGRQVMYFFPDIVLMQDGSKVGAVPYTDLKIKWEDSNFIEEGTVPRDAEIVGHTWKHPNKNGGPDRRFKSNYQIPICRYETMHLKSDSGVNELVEFSRRGVVSGFATALKQFTSGKRITDRNAAL